MEREYSFACLFYKRFENSGFLSSSEEKLQKAKRKQKEKKKRTQNLHGFEPGLFQKGLFIVEH